MTGHEQDHEPDTTSDGVFMEDSEWQRHPQKRTPLPKYQLFIAFLIQFSEPITASVILPFVPQFVRSTGITKGDEKKTGYYAGIIESAFFLAECLSVYPWGRLSDYYGRRILILGPLGLTVTMLAFGLSKSFWALVAFRCGQGIFNGNIGVSKTVLAELTDATNIAEAFTYIPLMWSFGSTLGPIIGGLLSNPATRYPDLFGGFSVLHEHPYFLPCSTAALIAFISFCFAFVGLEETHSRRRKQEKPSPPSSATSLVDGEQPHYGSTDQRTAVDLNLPTGDTISVYDKPPTIREVLVPRLRITLLNYGFLSFADMSYSVLIPLMYSTSIPIGGLGLSPHQIGVIMGSLGLSAALVQIFILSRLLKRFGPRIMFIASLMALFISVSAFPCMSYFAKRAGRVDAIVWTIMAVQLTCSLMLYMSYSSIQIMIVDSAPSKAALASTNSVSQIVACAIRSLAPSLASSFFAISLEHNLLGGRLVYFVLMGIILVATRIAFMLPKRLQMVR